MKKIICDNCGVECTFYYDVVQHMFDMNIKPLSLNDKVEIITLELSFCGDICEDQFIKRHKIETNP